MTADATPSNNTPSAMPGKNPLEIGIAQWSGLSLVCGLASDLMEPLGPVALYLLIAAIVAAAIFAFVLFTTPMKKTGRMGLAFALIGAFVFGAIVALQTFGAKDDSGAERGVIATYAPPLAALQRTVLPLSPTKKALLEFTGAITEGDATERAASAAAMIDAAAEDTTLRRALMERALRNDEANVRQIALVRAIADRRGADIPILPDTGAGDNALRNALTGARLQFNRINVETGAATGYFQVSNNSRHMTASIAGGRIITNSSYVLEGRVRPGLVIDLAPTEDMQLAGTARTQDGLEISVHAPLF